MRTKVLLLALLIAVVSVQPVLATNGDNLIAIGPIARAMGGVGIAAPQDAISAVFANPAAMCFGPYCPSTQVDFAGTLFMPHIDAKITTPGGTVAADADNKVYAIPAIGLSVPISKAQPYWRFGIAAYGVTGLGADYRGTALDHQNFFGPGAPLIAGEYTQLQIMKFAPAIACQPTERFSVGAALHVDYAALDLRSGTSSGFGFGGQVGAIYKVTDNISVGLNYVTPQSIDHDNVTDFDHDGKLDTLKLESPQQVGLGVSYTTLNNKLLLETDVKWINWGNANGYEDFGWSDQWVVGVGAQYYLTPKIALRTGYNYGANPVDTHNGFNGRSLTSVQGHQLPTYYYETFRLVGFPALVEHHITFGLGYQVTDKIALQAGYMHAFSKNIHETGTSITGDPVAIDSQLSEDGVDFSLTWRF